MKKKTDSRGRLSLQRILCIVLCLCLIGGIILTVEYFTREPIIIGVIDTGISSKAIPADHILEGKNYIDDAKTTEDTYGHGTAVASVILEHLPQAKFVPLVSNAYDTGKIKQVDNDTFAQMIKDAVNVYHCQIINLSVGLILDKTAVREAVEYAEQKGVLVVASAGNDYKSDGEFKYYPAGYDTVFAVGSVNRKETAVSDFSQRGEWVDIYTCGEKVKAATLSGKTKVNDGTSYSAAKVTARAGRLLQKNKSLTPAQLREKLLKKANELPDGKKYIE
ncbi:MAG: S8/S53 family peptidase [Clostridia bacterium]|nr:S8/S53 family peptidase [Clostridia bacterium]